MQSDIVNNDGDHILNWAMEGTRRSNTIQNYPYQPKPPKESWKIWRQCIHATYLGRKRTKDRLPLVTPLEYKEEQQNENDYEWLNRIKKG